MKFWIGTPANPQALAVHDLGEVILSSQQSSFEPVEMPVKETRTLVIRCDVWEQSYRDNYNLIEQIRNALRGSIEANIYLKMPDHRYSDGVTMHVIPGEDVLNRPCTIVDYNLPDDPNAAGTYQQAIVITCRFELVDLQKEGSDHLRAAFTKTGSGVIELGKVTNFRKGFRQSYYSEWRNLRERSTGQGACSGELLVTTTAVAVATRRAELKTLIDQLEEELNDKDGTLAYGPEGGRFFDQLVKVENFSAEINQAVNGIRWTMDFSYTNYPNEATYAGADYTVDSREDKEAGDQVFTISGRIIAATETIALTKLAAIRTAAMTQYGFNASHLVSAGKTPRHINADDGATFLEMAVNETYRMRMSNVLSYTLQVTTGVEDTNGMMTLTYSGKVVASGATASSAYTTAAAKARELGDNKHPFRVSGRLTRNDRQTDSTAAVEHISVDFSFDYKVKATRVYLEVESSTSSDTFGADVERVSGFVVAASYATAVQMYRDLVRNAYDNRLVQNEDLGQGAQRMAKGAYSSTGTWTASSGTTDLFTRLSFSFNAFKEKTGGHALQYAVTSSYDYVALSEQVSVKGTLSGTQAVLQAALDRASGNVLDTFLNGFVTGTRKRVSGDRNGNRQKAAAIDALLTVEFSETYQGRIPSLSQIIECEVSEDIVYSGTRYVAQDIPDGPSIVQDCGITPGSRVISGSVIAATEAACMTFIESMRVLAFPTGTGGGVAPTTRYRNPARISTSFTFVPQTSGVPRGEGANFQAVKKTFEFSEILPSFQYAS